MFFILLLFLLVLSISFCNFFKDILGRLIKVSSIRSYFYQSEIDLYYPIFEEINA